MLFRACELSRARHRTPSLSAVYLGYCAMLLEDCLAHAASAVLRQLSFGLALFRSLRFLSSTPLSNPYGAFIWKLLHLKLDSNPCMLVRSSNCYGNASP